MLFLTAKPGETIKIGDSILVHVVRVKGGKIRLGIHAPEDQYIRRPLDLDVDEAINSLNNPASQ